jgi:hypothetical protein
MIFEIFCMNFYLFNFEKKEENRRNRNACLFEIIKIARVGKKEQQHSTNSKNQKSSLSFINHNAFTNLT